MTNLTPTQIEALNRAIAEHARIELFEGKYILKKDGTYGLPDYTDSLDAIVEVVREWIKDSKNFQYFEIALEREFGSAFTGIIDLCENKQPALALCLAFAQAAGLDWEKSDAMS